MTDWERIEREQRARDRSAGSNYTPRFALFIAALLPMIIVLMLVLRLDDWT